MEQWSRAIFHVFPILFDGTLSAEAAAAWAHLHRFAEFHLTAMSGDPEAYRTQEEVDAAAAAAHEHLVAYARLAEKVSVSAVCPRDQSKPWYRGVGM